MDNREAKKTEAVERMEILGISKSAIERFKDGRISVSDPLSEAFVPASADDLERIREFEKRYNALVYAVVRDYSIIGKTDSYLVVSRYEEEWDMDRRDLENGQTCAYVYNHDEPDFSEFGSVGIKVTPKGSLVRAW